jgi:hypothetical protein
MLLFFIASALGGECNSELVSKKHIGNYNVYVCHEDLVEPTKKAINFWSGVVDNKFILHEGIYNCAKYKTIGDIFVEFNNAEIEDYYAEKEAQGIKLDVKVYGITSFIRNKHTKSFKYSTISISTKKKAIDNIDVLTAHEFGHAIGYDHISENCRSHVMNPFISGMNFNFY